jgi:TRAP-type uncharacterized transport system substrate-binding protein
VELKAEETPGAMFMIKYMHENLDKMISGEKPWVVQYGSTNSVRFIKEGWAPFTKVRFPGYSVFSSILCRINILGTFDPNIKTAKDLAGKRVAVAAKAAPFNSTLKYVPYFEKGLGVDVNWQFIGIDQGKDALLNGTVDATVCTFMGEYELAPDGKTFIITKAAPDSPTLQLLASGRKLHLIPFDPQVLMSTYKGEGMMTFNPALVKAGAADGVAADVTGLCEFLYMTCDEKTPDDIIIELLKVRYEQANKFGDYHAMFKMQPENPFPAGAPKELIHPAAYKAAKELGFKVIE